MSFFTQRLALGIFFLSALMASSCKESNTIPPASQSFVKTVPSSNATATEEETYHTDADYKYEYRTGESGNYQYNYDVIGTDADGNPVTGNVNMQGKYGTGIIIDEQGNETSVNLEWVGYGELEAIDENGNVWELGVD